MTASRSRFAHLLAVATSAVGLAAMLLVLLYFQLPRQVGVGLSLALPFLLGGLFGLRRAGTSGLVGLSVSSAFCIYFAAVFAALLLNSEKDWLVAFLAVGTPVAGWLGVLAGGRAARASRRHELGDAHLPAGSQ